MTVDTVARPTNGLVRASGISSIALQSAEVMQAWAAAASDAARFVTPLIYTDFMPEPFRPKNDTPEAFQLAVATGTAAVVFGLEVGLSPMQALRGVYVTKGTPAMYAGTMVGLVQSRGHEIWTEDLTDARAIVCGQRKGGTHVERATFTIQRAQQAGYIQRNAKYRTDPQSMLLARAQSDCARRVARDVLMGLYSIEEMWDEHGEGDPAPVQQRTIQRAPRGRSKQQAIEAASEAAPEPEAAKLAEDPKSRPGHQTKQRQPRPAPAEPPPAQDEPDGYDAAMSRPAAPVANKAQLTKLHTSFSELGVEDREKRLAYAMGVIDRDITSSKELTSTEASAVIEAIAADLNALDRAREETAVQPPGDEAP